jgi:hypothetical protein
MKLRRRGHVKPVTPTTADTINVRLHDTDARRRPDLAAFAHGIALAPPCRVALSLRV